MPRQIITADAIHRLFARTEGSPGRRPDRRFRPGSDLGGLEPPVRLEKLEQRMLLTGGQGAGKVSMQDFHFVMRAGLSDLGGSEPPVRLERLEGRVLVSHIQWSGSTGGDDRPMD
jgi:hypothetical protein